jgi:Histidine kinase-, DNA gyrase B-, and HSP90-like ATPase
MTRGKGKSSSGQQSLFTSHYEDDFLIRTIGDLVHRPEVALGELVANAWDAGAARVEVSIPQNHDQQLIVDDDGSGLTKALFDQRWMTLRLQPAEEPGQ